VINLVVAYPSPGSGDGILTAQVDPLIGAEIGAQTRTSLLGAAELPRGVLVAAARAAAAMGYEEHYRRRAQDRRRLTTLSALRWRMSALCGGNRARAAFPSHRDRTRTGTVRSGAGLIQRGQHGWSMATGELMHGKLFTMEQSQRGIAIVQARADAFARSMAGTIAALGREGITSSTAMAKALNSAVWRHGAAGAGPRSRSLRSGAAYSGSGSRPPDLAMTEHLEPVSVPSVAIGSQRRWWAWRRAG
jgi:hypothetical protein